MFATWTMGLAEWIIDDTCLVDPPGHGRIGGYYFHAGCPYVSQSQKTKTRYKTLPLVPGKQNTRYACMKIMTSYWLGPVGSSLFCQACLYIYIYKWKSFTYYDMSLVVGRTRPDDLERVAAKSWKLIFQPSWIRQNIFLRSNFFSFFSDWYFL